MQNDLLHVWSRNVSGGGLAWGRELSPLFFFFLQIYEGAGIWLGLFNASELRVKVKLPLRRWQCLKGGSGRPRWRRFKGSGSIFHVFLVRGDENVQGSRCKCTSRMRSLYVSNGINVWMKKKGLEQGKAPQKRNLTYRSLFQNFAVLVSLCIH